MYLCSYRMYDESSGRELDLRPTGELHDAMIAEAPEMAAFMPQAKHARRRHLDPAPPASVHRSALGQVRWGSRGPVDGRTPHACNFATLRRCRDVWRG